MTDERILLAGGGDLGMRIAQRLAGSDDAPALWALRRHPPQDTATTPDRQSAAPQDDERAAEGGAAKVPAATGRAAAASPGGNTPLQWLAADVTQPQTLGALPPGITRLVYALAPGARTEDAYREVFIDGLRHLLQALDTRRLRRIVFVSSSAVYGDHDGGWIDETTPAAPLGMNGAVLLQAEQWLAAQGLPATSLRLAGLYGPGRLQLVRRLCAGQVRVPRGTQHWANRMHADDAAAAIAHLLMLPQVEDVYLGTDDTPLPLDTLYDHIAALAGCPPPPDGPAPAGVGSKRLSNARLRASGFSPAWPDARDGYAALLAQDPRR
jgi:nucleoside-diphosphate-sugar epimerase